MRDHRDHRPVQKKRATKPKSTKPLGVVVSKSAGRTVLEYKFVATKSKKSTTSTTHTKRDSTGEQCKVCRKVARVGFYGCCSKRCQELNRL